MLKYQVESNRGKMKTSLFLLILTAQCFCATCHVYEYHFVRRLMSWDEAKSFCKEKYTDLATVFDLTDLERLTGWRGNRKKAWIGLFSSPVKDNRMWHWSLPWLEFDDSTTNWFEGEPNDKISPEDCVMMTANEWKDAPCTEMFPFICYNETQTGAERFHLINQSKTWPEAHRYCREHHTDLISGPEQLNGSRSEGTLWTGLFRDTWRWSDGSNSSLRHWNQQQFVSGADGKKCAVLLKNSRNWETHTCSDEKSFFCYEDNVVLVNKNLTWEDALYYCRDHYNDLVSITNHHQQRWVQARAKDAFTSHVWLGLRYTCTLDFWFWVSDEVVRYENWAQGQETDGCDMSGAMDKEGGHEWFKKQDQEKFNFFCSK